MRTVPLSTDRHRPRVRTVNDLDSKTVQSDRENSEIKAILERFTDEGMMLEHMQGVDLQFMDVTQFEDFADLMRQTKKAEEVFLTLPSKLREVFDHQVEKWLDAAHDPEKLEALRPQLEELGVMEPLKVEEEVVEVPPPEEVAGPEGPAGTV